MTSHPTPAIIDQAIEVLKIEAEGILNLTRSIDENFARLADLVFHAKGRLIIAGIGKSGIVGRKIVATLISTGTNAFFLHPVEAMHGDLGMVSPHDVFLAISNSGETQELNALLPSIKNIGCQTAAFTGTPQSTLAGQCDLVVNTGVDKEACPMGLAPTASTTAQLAMGDALAVVLINKRDFRSSDFRKVHPGGQLGQRLSNKVRELMLSGPKIPQVPLNTDIAAALTHMDQKKLGIVLIVNPDQTIAGVITDGDVRRWVVRKKNIFDMQVSDLMTPNPRAITADAPAYDALYVMEQFQITALPVIDSQGVVTGILHLHDILGKGSFRFQPDASSSEAV